MAVSDIDHIFASSKGKGKLTQISSLPSSALPEKPKKKVEDKQKRKREEAPNDGEPVSKKRTTPETVSDTSTRLPKAKRARVEKSSVGNERSSTSRKDSVKDKDDDQRFKDSRGSGPRRKTEEGWSIYKEDELGIGDEGGDTPLCPFDCDCCF